MHKIETFDFADGHIQSITIEPDCTKVAFSSWDGKRFNFIFNDSYYLQDSASCGKETSHVEVEALQKGVSKTLDDALECYDKDVPAKLFRFYEPWENRIVLTIAASSVEIVSCDC
ncbi:MAG: hypothetical protein FWG66_14620 [Spirochaetes bacterium]|nr:hypothetical protein [Spirochaetota bacterium]